MATFLSLDACDGGEPADDSEAKASERPSRDG